MSEAQAKILKEVVAANGHNSVEFTVSVFEAEQARGITGDANFGAAEGRKGAKRPSWVPPKELQQMPHEWLDPALFEAHLATRMGPDGKPVLKQFLPGKEVLPPKYPSTREFAYDNRWFDAELLSASDERAPLRNGSSFLRLTSMAKGLMRRVI